MRSRLWLKFAALLLLVAAVSLSSALILRTFIVREFTGYLEGEMEDRVYWVTADLEGAYERNGGWRAETLAEDAVWALLLGMETRVIDAGGSVVMDTARALETLPPLSRERVQAVSALEKAGRSADCVLYPLFLAGKEIGRLDVRFLPLGKEDLFIRRSNLFLLASSLLIGGLVVVLSIIFARRLTAPIRTLAEAAEAIGRGNLKTRVEARGSDELASLSRTFNRMAHTLELQESLRKKLCANAAHELRTPLAAMRGELEGMMDGLIPSGQDQLKSLHDETGRLTNVIAAMEELIQAEASVLSLNKQEIRLRPFLARIVERYGVLFREKGVELRLACEDQITAVADPERLSQILVNLLGNALKATEPGGSVSVRSCPTGSGAAIAVEDTGCGIGPEELPFIFERFYRGERGGLGLGLAIVRELVEAHGGRIDVQSEPGKGSVFTVVLTER